MLQHDLVAQRVAHPRRRLFGRQSVLMPQQLDLAMRRGRLLEHVPMQLGAVAMQMPLHVLQERAQYGCDLRLHRLGGLVQAIDELGIQGLRHKLGAYRRQGHAGLFGFPVDDVFAPWGHRNGAEGVAGRAGQFLKPCGRDALQPQMVRSLVQVVVVLLEVEGLRRVELDLPQMPLGIAQRHVDRAERLISLGEVVDQLHPRVPLLVQRSLDAAASGCEILGRQHDAVAQRVVDLRYGVFQRHVLVRHHLLELFLQRARRLQPMAQTGQLRADRLRDVAQRRRDRRIHAAGAIGKQPDRLADIQCRRVRKACLWRRRWRQQAPLLQGLHRVNHDAGSHGRVMPQLRFRLLGIEAPVMHGIGRFLAVRHAADALAERAFTAQAGLDHLGEQFGPRVGFQRVRPDLDGDGAQVAQGELRRASHQARLALRKLLARQPAYRIVFQDGLDARAGVAGLLVRLCQQWEPVSQPGRRPGSLGRGGGLEPEDLIMQQLGGLLGFGQMGVGDRFERMVAQHIQCLQVRLLRLELLEQAVSQRALDAVIDTEHHVARHRFAHVVGLRQKTLGEDAGGAPETASALLGQNLGRPAGLVLPVLGILRRCRGFPRLEGALLAAALFAVVHHAGNVRGQLGIARIHEGIVAVGVHVPLAQLGDRQGTQPPGDHHLLDAQAAGAAHLGRQRGAVAAGDPA